MAVFRRYRIKRFGYGLMVLWLALVAPLACPIYCHFVHQQVATIDSYVCGMAADGADGAGAAPAHQLLALPSPLLLAMLATPIVWVLRATWTRAVVMWLEYQNFVIVPTTPPPRHFLAQS